MGVLVSTSFSISFEQLGWGGYLQAAFWDASPGQHRIRQTHNITPHMRVIGATTPPLLKNNQFAYHPNTPVYAIWIAAITTPLTAAFLVLPPATKTFHA